MRLFIRQAVWAALWLLIGATGYHVAFFHVWPWWMSRQAPERLERLYVTSVSALFKADDVLVVDVEAADSKQWWNVLWYALRSDRPRERVVLVPHEGGPNVHSLYLLTGERGHRITIQGLEIRAAQPPPQHLAAR